MNTAPLIAIALEPVDGDVALAIAAILGDRQLRAALYGGRGNVAQAYAISAWCGAGSAGTLRMAARCPELGEIVGAIRVVGGELSYFIARAHWSSGYGLATVRALLRLPSDPRSDSPLFARVARENVASRRLLAAAGFAERGLEVRPAGLSPSVRYERIAPHSLLNN